MSQTLPDEDFSGTDNQVDDVENTEATETQTVEEDDRTIFVGGIHTESKEFEVREFFEKFGVVEKCQLKIDYNTGRSRGFAFVTFADVATVGMVLAEAQLKLNGRAIDAKPAQKREVSTKVFVGGLGRQGTDDEIRLYFEKFGKIKEIDLPVDPNNVRKGFCFITYATKEGMEAATKERMQEVLGKQCEVKKSVPKNIHQSRMGPPDRGRGRGAPMSNYGGYHPYGPYSAGYAQSYPGYDTSYAYADDYGYSGYGDAGWSGYYMSGYDYGYGAGYQGQQSNYGKYPKRGGRGGYSGY